MENDPELIKVFDFNGNNVKEINDSNEDTYFIETYYNDKLNKNYIITGNKGYIKSYDFINNKIFHTYDDNDGKCHYSLIINDGNLIDSSGEGNIKIWNFQTGVLLNKIYVCDNILFGMCLWNKDYLFVGTMKDYSIKVIDLKNGKEIKDLTGHNNFVLTIKKIIHPKYGECLVSQDCHGYSDNQIKIWSIKK